MLNSVCIAIIHLNSVFICIKTLKLLINLSNIQKLSYLIFFKNHKLWISFLIFPPLNKYKNLRNGKFYT